MHWLTIAWWKYLLRSPDRRYWKIIWRELWIDRVHYYYAVKERISDYKTCFICRMRGHSDKTGKAYGVVFYNPNGYEPDMTCLNCGDDLG